MDIALVEPEIPPNTGNIARTCVMTGSKLHLIEPLGFSIADKDVKRSGLDYWSWLNFECYPDYSTFKVHNSKSRLILFSTKGEKYYHQITYHIDDILVFGSETKGLADEILAQEEIIVRIPMIREIPRSLNLGNSVALTLYEALRQINFPGML